MEFRKEEDKEEAVRGSDPPPLAATLPTFHTGVRTLLAAAPGGRGGGIRALPWSPLGSAAVNKSAAAPEHKCREPQRRAATLRLGHNAGKNNRYKKMTFICIVALCQK